MKIFVTVGTTTFDSMVQRLDLAANSLPEFEFIFQISKGNYKPKNGVSFSFSEEIYDYYIDSDLIVTHAGAGSIFKLLELEKKILVVPNLDRIDKHQSDIAAYMERNNHLLVAWSLDEIDDILAKARSFTPTKYKKNSFFMYKDIASFLRN